MSSVERSIKDLIRVVTLREKRKIELAGVVQQDSLILSRRERSPQLGNLLIKPSIGGRKVSGQLQAHNNGFRFTTVKGMNVDILYANIQHAFFQPAEGETVVILHFKLKNDIVIGKKRTTDVQFYQETMDASQRLDARRNNYGDQDEIQVFFFF